jgi:hypothetical protein
MHLPFGVRVRVCVDKWYFVCVYATRVVYVCVLWSDCEDLKYCWLPVPHKAALQRLACEARRAFLHCLDALHCTECETNCL